MKRKSNFEILRIISIIFILFHHFFYENVILDYTSSITINQFISQVLYSLGKIGVNIFILITGYFCINSNFKLKKILTIWLQTIFYSWIILVVYICFNGFGEVGLKNILKSIFPIIYNHYWFITAYVILYILSGYLNIVLKNISRKQYIILLGVLLTIWCVLPSVMYGKIDFSNIDWFILMYMVGAFIQLHPLKIFDNKKIIKILLLLFAFLGITSIYLLDKIYYILEIDPTHFSLPMNQIIPLGISICIFLLFKNLQIENNNIINKIASTTLGIYLIHTNILIRDFIWIDILKVNTLTNSQYLILYEVFAVVLVFLLCVVIDLIRQFIFSKFLDKFIDFLESKIKIGAKVK
ncbi:MAG: acyltransferase [Clostridia bacterium]|nr:acyltransferase [Clostridia bacterium]